jgi:phosphoribosyl 1,2-cyclic phosphodiesterase
MILRFRVLGSGSSGNATLIEGGSTRLLIDAGLGPRSLADRVKSAGVDPGSISALLVSHEHGDHIRGAAAFSTKWGVPVCSSRGTRAAAGLVGAGIAGFESIEAGTTRRFGALTVTGIGVPHDAAAPLGFMIACGETSLGHVTDLGHVTSGLVTSLRSCKAILIEANYDPVLLRDGPYPWALKERIFSPQGHLANPDVAGYLEHGLGASCRRVVLAHLSEKNNHPELVAAAAEQALDRSGRREIVFSVALRDGTGWIEVETPTRSVPSGQIPLF